MKRFIYLSFIIFLSPVQLKAEGLAPVSLDHVIDLALKNNPEIKAAEHAWRVSKAQISPTGTWPNPTFTYIDEKFPSGVEGMPNESVKHYRVEQMVPFPGKLSSEEKMKYHEALIAEAVYRSKVIDVTNEIRISFYRFYLTDQKIILARQTVEALRSVLKTAQSRLASGQSTTSDVFMSQMELRKMENMLFEQEQERTLIEIELNTLLSQPTKTEWGPAEAPELIDVPKSIDELQAMAKQNAPQYWSAAHEINHARAMTSRNRLEYLPDFNLMYERETAKEGDPGRQVGIGLSIPLWFERPVGLAKSSKEHLIETQAMSQGTENMVMKMVHMEYVETLTHLTMARKYEKDIVPTAQSNLKIVRQQYASGRGDFLRTLEALRAWIEAHNEYQQELFRYAESWSQLEKWVGTDFTKTKDAPKENQHAH